MALRAKRSSLTDQVAELLGRYIEENNLQPGEELPTEMELSRIFGVSRTVIREGLRSAAAVGLIESESGRRSRVGGLSSQVLDHFFSIAMRLDTHAVTELLEVREAMESYAVQLAAGNAEGSSLEKLQEHLQAMDAALRSGDQASFIEADVAFHQQLAVMSGNRVLTHLLQALGGATRQSISSGLSARRTAQALELVQQVHNEIYAAIEKRDAPAAAEAMRRHFRTALAALRGQSDGD